MKTLWHETAHIAPPIGKVVLGWWEEEFLSAVVRSFNTHWRVSGWESEVREPLFWAELPESPMPSNSEPPRP